MVDVRRKIEPVGYEEVMAFVDYADKPGELKSIRMPIHEVPPHCEALRKKRIEYTYSLRRAAKLLGMTAAELSGIEHGRLECSEREAQGFMGRIATAWMDENHPSNRSGNDGASLALEKLRERQSRILGI